MTEPIRRLKFTFERRCPFKIPDSYKRNEKMHSSFTERWVSNWLQEENKTQANKQQMASNSDTSTAETNTSSRV